MPPSKKPPPYNSNYGFCLQVHNFRIIIITPCLFTPFSIIISK